MQLPAVPAYDLKGYRSMSTPYHFRLFAPWFPAVLVLGLTGCFEKDDPLGSEVENEVSARIFLADGSPASGASVKIYSVNHNPQEPAHAVIFSTRTDSQGRYAVDSVPRGEYNVLSDLNGEVAYQDSVFLSGGKGALQSDTLRAPGELFGRVRIQPNHDPRTVTLQVLGTNMFANVDDSGGFVLKGLAEGIYRVRLVTTLPEYTPSFVTLRFRSGRTDTLPDPLALTYTGIPVVDGVRVAFDTLNGVAMLAWKPVKYSALSEFLVFRNSAMALTPSVVPIARTRDTFFTDTLYRTERGPMDTVGQKLEYRVAVRNKSDEVGKSYGFVVANAAPPGAVRTHMSLSLAGTMGGQASIGDTVSISLAYTNYSRKQHRIVWRVDNAEGPLRE